MKTVKEQAEILQDLLDRCNDSKKGYEQAAESADTMSLKLHLHNIALERKDMGARLAEVVNSLGGDPSKGGTLKGAIHRNWLNVKAALSSNTEENVLEECLRGEQRLIEDYMETLNEGEFEHGVHSVLVNQLANVQARVARMNSLLEKVS